MSDTRTALPFASLTPADLLLFALDHTPNKAKKEVCLYVRENLSKAPMFHGMRTSSNTFLDGLTFRNRVPTAFKNSQPAMNAFINTLLKETHIQLLADKDVHHEDPFKNAGEFSMLEYFMRHVNSVLIHEQIIAHVWGNGLQQDVQYLRVTLARLRQKLRAAGMQDDCGIVSHSGIGYRMETLPQ